MTFKDGLLRARGQIMFLLGLIAASAVVIRLEQKHQVPCPPAPAARSVNRAAMLVDASTEGRRHWDQLVAMQVRDSEGAARLLLGAATAERLGVARAEEVSAARARALAYLRQSQQTMSEANAVSSSADAALLDALVHGGTIAEANH